MLISDNGSYEVIASQHREKASSEMKQYPVTSDSKFYGGNRKY